MNRTLGSLQVPILYQNLFLFILFFLTRSSDPKYSHSILPTPFFPFFSSWLYTYPVLLILVTYSSCSSHPVLLILFFSSCSSHPVLLILYFLSSFSNPALLILFFSSCSSHPVSFFLFFHYLFYYFIPSSFHTSCYPVMLPFE